MAMSWTSFWSRTAAGSLIHPLRDPAVLVGCADMFYYVGAPRHHGNVPAFVWQKTIDPINGRKVVGAFFVRDEKRYPKDWADSRSGATNFLQKFIISHLQIVLTIPVLALSTLSRRSPLHCYEKVFFNIETRPRFCECKLLRFLFEITRISERLHLSASLRAVLFWVISSTLALGDATAYATLVSEVPAAVCSIGSDPALCPALGAQLATRNSHRLDSVDDTKMDIVSGWSQPIWR